MHRAPPDSTAWFGSERVAIARLAGSGFSGSRVFVVQRASGARFVLKNFSPATPAAHAAWVHGLMRHLRASGLETVPAVVALRPEHEQPAGAGCSTLAADPAGMLWELVAYIPGSPRPAPTAAEAAAALAGLARLHLAAATFPASPPRTEPSPGVERRVEQAARIRASPWRWLDPAGASGPIRDTLLHAIEVFEACRGDAAIESIAATDIAPVVTQPVLRDAWSDHALFADDGSFAGFVDFHAAGRDTPATDLARLLGSWHAPIEDLGGPFQHRWQPALDAYEAVRPLSPRERNLVPWLHATGVICGLDNWFRWLITDRRTFDDMSRVGERIDRLLRHLPEALETSREAISGRN